MHWGFPQKNCNHVEAINGNSRGHFKIYWNSKGLNLKKKKEKSIWGVQNFKKLRKKEKNFGWSFCSLSNISSNSFCCNHINSQDFYHNLPTLCVFVFTDSMIFLYSMLLSCFSSKVVNDWGILSLYKSFPLSWLV